MGKSDQGVQSSADRYRTIPRALVFVFNGSDVLLLKGAPTKRIWAGLYNGVGGHVEHDEDVYTAALRETREETGLHLDRLQLCGVVNIDVGPGRKGERTGIMMFVFRAHSPQRALHPSEEGTLEWAPVASLHKNEMVPDLPVLLDRIVHMDDRSPPFFGRYWYDEQDRLQIAFAR